MPLTGASLRAVVDELEALEQLAIVQADDDAGDYATPLSYERWRPAAMPELPCVYNWLATSPATQQSVGILREVFDLRCRVALPNVAEDSGQQVGGLVETYADAFRSVLDPVLWATGQPLGVQKTERNAMQMVLDTFNEVDVLCIEFAVLAHVNRNLTT